MRFQRSIARVLALGVVLASGLVPSVGAQTFEVVHSFTRAEPAAGPWPAWAPIDLVAGEEGRLYGATSYGGGDCWAAPYGSTCGVVFQLDLDGGFRAIRDLSNTQYSQGVRLSWLGTGELFVTESTYWSFGRLSKVTPAASGEWEWTELHLFGSDTRDSQTGLVHRDGRGPLGPVMLGGDGRLYGTTVAGGDRQGRFAEGSLFRLWPDGSGYEILHAFHREDYQAGIVGLNPMGRLVTGSDGHVYGTAYHGGSNDPVYPGYGTIYRYRADTGQVEKLHSFGQSREAGYAPRAGLVRGPGGQLFGTTLAGGGPSFDGTVFKMTAGPEAGASAAVSYVHLFAVGGDARYPTMEVTFAPDGYLYGATLMGGSHDLGAVFRSRPDGSDYSVVHSFSGGEDGGFPSSAPVVGSDGNLYGAAKEGGANGGGVIYRVGISPQARIDGLVERVRELVDEGTLKLGQGASLIVKLELALRALDEGRAGKAITMLEAFVHEVRAFRNAGILEPAEADEMIAIAEAVIASISG